MAQFLEQYGGYLLAGVFALALLWALAAGRRKTERQWTHLNRSLEQSSRRMAEMRSFGFDPHGGFAESAGNVGSLERHEPVFPENYGNLRL